MAGLTGQTPGIPDYTYKGLLNINSDDLGLTASLRDVKDGLGNNSGIQLSTSIFAYTGIFRLASLTASTVPVLDGSKNVISSSVTATELSYVSGVTSAIQTQLNTKITSSVTTLSSLTSIGTIGTGVWQATAIGAIYGGTGFTTYATGDIIYASAVNTLSKLAAGTNGHVLTLAGGVPTWAAGGGGGGGITIGTTAIADGTAGRILYEKSDNTVTEIAGLFYDDVNFVFKVNAVPGVYIPNQTNYTGSTFFGVQPASMTSGTAKWNVGVGIDALKVLTTGIENVAMGFNALYSNTSGSQNTAVGTYAGYSMISGTVNSFYGYEAAYYQLGTGNSAFGYLALMGPSGGSAGGRNSAFGNEALKLNNAADNAAFGAYALRINSTGTTNSAFGSFGGYDVTTGSGNTFVGYNTGGGIATGDNNTIIGANVFGLSSSLASNIILATGAGVIRIQWNSSGVPLWTGVPTGNAGLSTGQMYQDTAATILANGDKVLALKS